MRLAPFGIPTHNLWISISGKQKSSRERMLSVMSGRGGLLTPPGYMPGRRYPLVIQTHGFGRSVFLSSGVFNSSTFAARALAALGIVVLQLDWNPNVFGTSDEGPAEVAVFESAVKKLTAEGVIDPARVGAIGFSRSVYHVLEALTRTKLFAAASITDGLTMSYFEYLEAAGDGVTGRTMESIYGGGPLKEAGRETWGAKT